MKEKEYTHIKPVTEAIRNFSDLQNKLDEMYNRLEIDDSTEFEYEICRLCQAESILSEDSYIIAKELMSLEQNDKLTKEFAEYIEKYMNSRENVRYLGRNMKSTEDSKRMLLATMIIDEYLNFLSGDDWDGPKNTNLVANLKCLELIRKQYDIDIEKYIDTIHKIVSDNREYKKMKSLLGKLQSKDLVNNELIIRMMISDTKEDI